MTPPVRKESIMTPNKKQSTSGSGIVEYVLITAFVAIVTVAVFKTFRADVTAAYQKAGQALLSGIEETTVPSPGQE